LDPVLLCCHHRILGVSLALDASKASGISVQGGSLGRHLLPEGVAVESTCTCWGRLTPTDFAVTSIASNFSPRQTPVENMFDASKLAA